MIKPVANIGQMLPYGELIRGFANQSSVSAAEIKKVLRSRGVFFTNNEKEVIVPALTTLLLSPSEFHVLRECQNTREDNLKKSSSRIQTTGVADLLDVMPQSDALATALNNEHTNYKLTKPPTVVVADKNPNKILVNFELERYDLNKSWYASNNLFSGQLTLEKDASSEVLIIKSYTSSESEEVGSQLQNFIVQHFKNSGFVSQTSELEKILFKDFTNEERIMFLFQLSHKMNSVYFDFIDIEDVQFRPDENETLPPGIDWMERKRQLVFKGSELHNTSFIKDRDFHKYLQFWSLDSKFNYTIDGGKGSCVVTFGFRDFSQKQQRAEFEINIAGLTPASNQLIQKEKNVLKRQLLDKLEERKNQLYKSFLEKKSTPDGTQGDAEVLIPTAVG